MFSNAAPIAVDDPSLGWGVGGVPFSIPAPGVLGNDVDFDGSPLKAVDVSAPTSALGEALDWVTVHSDGSVDLDPPVRFFGSVLFSYRASDGAALSAQPAHVSIAVQNATVEPTPFEEPLYCSACACACEQTPLGHNKNDGAMLVSHNRWLRYIGSGNLQPHIVFDTSWAGPTPTTIEAHLHVDQQDLGSISYSTSGFLPAESYRIAFQPDLTSLEGGARTGLHEVEVVMKIERPGQPPEYPRYRGFKIVNALTPSASPSHGLGVGWSLLPLERLMPVNSDLNDEGRVDDYLWIKGDGNAFSFTHLGDGRFDHPRGDVDHNELSIDAGGQRLRDKFGTTRVFADGLLRRLEDRNGNRTTYEYTGDKLSRVIDPGGRVTTFTYAGGVVTTITDFAGRATELSYDGDLLTMIRRPDPDGDGPDPAPEISFAYDGANRLESLIDPAGGEHIFAYDDAHTLIAHTLPDGSETRLTAQQTSGMVLGAYHQGVAADLFRTADVRGDFRDELGSIWSFTTDSFGNVATMIDPLGNQRTWTLNADGQVTSILEPDPDAEGPLPAPSHHFRYDPKGNMTSETRWNTTTQSWTHDGEFSQVISHVTIHGAKVVNMLDEHGNLLESRAVVGALDENEDTDPDDVVTTYAYTTTGIKGLVRTLSDPLGRRTDFEYDLRGLLTRADYAVGSPVQASMEWAYDVADRMSDFWDELRRRTRYSYDDLDRLRAIRSPDPDEDGPLAAPVHAYHHDVMGRLVREVDPLGRETLYAYDAVGNLTSLARPDHDHDGNPSVTGFVYDAARRRTRKVDPLGRVTEYRYNAIHQMTEAVEPDPDGHGPDTAPIHRYDHDPLDRLVRYTDPLGGVTDYLHENHGYRLVTTFPEPLDGATRPVTVDSFNPAAQLDTHTDPLGRATRYVYDQFGRPIEVTRSGGELDETVSVRHGYDAVDNLRWTADELGYVTEYRYDARDRLTLVSLADPDGAGPLARPEFSYAYDAAGQPLAVTDPLGNETAFAHDALGRLVTVTSADPDDGGPLTRPQHHFAYDAIGNLLREVDALGNATDYEYDALDHRIAVVRADPDGAGSATRPRTSFAYSATGRLLKRTDALNRVTTYGHDDLDRLIQITAPDPDGEGVLSAPLETYRYDLLGNRLSATDALGRVTDFTYDRLRRLIATTQPDPDGPGPQTRPVWSNEYDLAGQAIGEVDPLGRVTRREFDYLGRQVAATLPDPDGDGAETAPIERTIHDDAGNLVARIDALGRQTDFQYDRLHRLTSVARPAPDDGPISRPIELFRYDAASRLLAETDPLGRTTTFQYDGLNRLVRRQSPDPDGDGPQVAASQQFTYDAVGNRLAEKNSLGETTAFVYDDLHRMTGRIDANGDAVLYAHDAVGNVVRLVDPLGNATAWEFDELDRVIAETNAFSDSRSFAYDAAGRLVSQVDRNGRLTEFQYDRLNRRTAEIWKDRNAAVRTLHYGYDLVGNVISASDASAAYRYSYDGLNRAVAVDQDYASMTTDFAFTVSFDAVGNRIGLRAERGGTLDFHNVYAFDSLDRMTSVEQSSDSDKHISDKRVDFTYDLADQLESIERYEQLETPALVVASEYRWDAAGRLTELTHGPIAALASYQWAYDAAGRVTARSSSVDGETLYGYDPRGQLTDAASESQPHESFRYDSNGNRTDAPYEIEVNNRLRADGIHEYEYDAEGNRVLRREISTGDTTTYVWDHRNRLLALVEREAGESEPVKVVEYEYDVLDRRIQKTVSTGVGPASADKIQRYVHDGAHVALVFDGDAVLTNRYLHGSAVDQILADDQITREGAVNTIWPLTDDLGTVRDLVDYDATAEASIVNHLAYDAFGSMVSESEPSIDHAFGFTGRDRDEESDLQFNRARYYDPAVGRWISEDPLGFAAGDANLVRYVDNDPANATDPTGLVRSRWEIYRLEVAREFALLARAAYKGSDWKEIIKKWKPTLVADHATDGFRAVVFENRTTGQAVLALAGTKFTSAKDWKCNLSQSFGLTSSQYEKAIGLARILKSKYGKDLIIVGHSLGGGLASAAAIVTDTRAVTFNPSGLHPKTVRRHGQSLKNAEHLIDSYHVIGDPLTTIENATFGALGQVYKNLLGPDVRPELLPDSVGKTLQMFYVGRAGPMERHGMDCMLKAIDQQIERTKTMPKDLRVLVRRLAWMFGVID